MAPNKNPADQGGISVKHYMTSILQKLHVRSRTEAALIAMQHGVAGDQ